MTITLTLTAEKASFILKRPSQLFTATFKDIKDGFLQVEVKFEEAHLNFVVQELIYAGEDWVVNLFKNTINENNLPR